MAVLSPVAKQQFFDNDGNPAAGYLLYTYATGTSTPLATYSDEEGETPNANPIVLDSRGEATIYLPEATTYDYVLKTAAEATVWTRSKIATPTASVNFLQAGTGAVSRTMQEKAREVVSVKDFGAVGDGTTDDTDAVSAALNHAKSIGGEARFPPGIYRVTSAFTQDVAGKDVVISGESTHRYGTGTTGTVILLDNTDADSYFYDMAAIHHLHVKNIEFRCAQEVQDRDFFRFTGTPGLKFTFDNVTFQDVERPLVFKDGSYFQMGVLNNVQFRDSGTLHSESTDLVGTLLVLDSVHHEESVPENTEKVVCNLSGIRQIQGRNVLLEGALPSSGWTILKHHNAFNPAWNRKQTAEYHGFWSEWSGTQPDYVLDQISGRVTMSQATLILSSTTRVRLDDFAYCELKDCALTSHDDPPEDLFVFSDFGSHLKLNQCSLRATMNPAVQLPMTNPQITFENCSDARDGSAAAERFVATVFSNDVAAEVFRWRGGYIDGDAATLSLYNGTTSTPSTDATYGRKLVITPPGASQINAFFEFKLRDTLAQYSQLFLVAKVKLPTYSSGHVLALVAEDGAVSTIHGFSGVIYSGQIIDLCLPVVVTAAVTAKVGFALQGSAMSGVSGDLEVLSLGVYAGNSAPRFVYPGYDKNIVTYNSAAPTAGAWKAGDVVLDNSPSAGGNLGWTCVTTGSPGTWVPFGPIQAANAYTATNVTTDRSFDADTVAVAELADVVGTLIADLKLSGVLK